MAVQVNRVMIHSQIDHADANSITEANNERSVGWSSFPVNQQPVEFHVHGVRNDVVRQNGVLLQNHHEVFVCGRPIRLLRMHDEGSKHAHHFLHRHM